VNDVRPFTISFLAIVAALTSVRASEPGTVSNWSYYGLSGGGPRIVIPEPGTKRGAPFPLSWTRCAGEISVYNPPMPTLGPVANSCDSGKAWHRWKKDPTLPPRTLKLGWHTYWTPSPRPGVNVSVYP
jgi:hypothetical protein